MGDLWADADAATPPAKPNPSAATPPASPTAKQTSSPVASLTGALKSIIGIPPRVEDRQTIPDEIVLGDEAPPETDRAPEAEAPPAEQGFGSMLNLEESESSDAQMRRPMSNSPAPTPPPPPASASTLQKMREQGFYRQQYFKDARCFDCEHRFKVGRSAKSANCPQCGSYVSLEDVEINMNSNQAIKTRGDVMIRKRGHLSTSMVQCKDLRCYGILEANVECDSDAIFRTEGTIIGEIKCHRCVVEKGANVTFMKPIRANEVEIQGNVTGNIFSSGPVLINAHGSVNGDVTARSVSIEPGGELNGAMNIIRGQAPVVPPPDNGPVAE